MTVMHPREVVSILTMLGSSGWDPNLLPSPPGCNDSDTAMAYYPGGEGLGVRGATNPQAATLTPSPSPSAGHRLAKIMGSRAEGEGS